MNWKKSRAGNFTLHTLLKIAITQQNVISQHQIGNDDATVLSNMLAMTSFNINMAQIKGVIVALQTQWSSIGNSTPPPPSSILII